jgi:O-methyltransferase involved in polyketide biosynthesis
MALGAIMAATKTGSARMTHYEKISPTAKLVAYLRGFSDIPFAREIAEESGADRTFRELGGQSSESLVRLAPFWEARYRVTDRIISQRSITQILEVAAGLSPRGLAMTQNSGIVYVVTDLPQILDEEKAIAETILLKSNNRRPKLHFEAANALDRESLSRASAVFGFDQPIAIITEGLLPYLNRKEKAVLAGNVNEILRKYGGIWIASDVHTRHYLAEISQFEQSIRQRLNSISNITDRNLEENLFALWIQRGGIPAFERGCRFDFSENLESNSARDRKNSASTRYGQDPNSDSSEYIRYSTQHVVKHGSTVAYVLYLLFQNVKCGLSGPIKLGPHARLSAECKTRVGATILWVEPTLQNRPS